jgi:hypothetical protein
MTKRLFAIMFAVTIFTVFYASSARAQTSQTIQFEAPFAFTTNNRTLPAGTYRIEPANDSRAVWTVRNSDDGSARFVLSASIVGKTDGDVHVTFRQYGDKYLLIGFKTASYEISLPSSARDKNLMASKSVVNIPVGPGGSH